MSAYHAFKKRPQGITEWEKEEYHKEDGTTDFRYIIHVGEIFCRAAIPGSNVLCSTITHYNARTALILHMKNLHHSEWEKLAPRPKGKALKADKDTAAVHFGAQGILIERASREIAELVAQTEEQTTKPKRVTKPLQRSKKAASAGRSTAAVAGALASRAKAVRKWKLEQFDEEDDDPYYTVEE